MSLNETEGAGKAGCPPHPRPPVRKKCTGVETTGVGGSIRPSLRNGFNGFLRALPGDHAWLPPSPVRRVSVFTNLAPASERQNHTTSPSAKTPLVLRAAPSLASCLAQRSSARATLSRPSHSGPTSVTTRTPLRSGRHGEQETTDLGARRSELFFRVGLDDPNQVESAREIAVYAQAIFGRMTRRLSEFARSPIA